MSDLAGRSLLSLVAIASAVGPYVADWNKTHVFNPKWPGHAKFHNGQTMSLGLVLGIVGLYLLWTPAVSAQYARSIAPSARAALERFRLRAGSFCACIFFVTQASAIFYPGALCVDREFGEGCPQVWIDSVTVGLAALGYGLAIGQVDARAGVKDHKVRL